MDADDFHNSECLIERLTARDQLLAINVAAYPTAKREWQKKYHKTMFQQAYPRDSSEGPELSTADFARLVGG